MSEQHEHASTDVSTDVPTDVPTDVSGRHPVNVGHLVMGIAFLGLTLVWVLRFTGTVSGGDLRWLMPAPWLAAGLAGLAAVVWGSRRR